MQLKTLEFYLGYVKDSLAETVLFMLSDSNMQVQVQIYALLANSWQANEQGRNENNENH